MKKLIAIAFAALSVLVMASCTPEEPVDALTVNTSEISFTNDGGSQSVSFTTNVDWTAAPDQDWITVSAGSGAAGDATITITVAANTEFASRSGKVTVTAGNAKTVFNVSQSEPVVFEAGAPCTVSAIAQQVVLNVNTNETFDVTVEEAAKSWISVASTKAAPVASKITVNVAANTGLQSRTGVVTVKTPSNSFAFTITQMSDFTETELVSAKYLGMAMKIYDAENSVYLSYDEFLVSLKNGDDVVNIAVNVEEGADQTAFPEGEFVVASDNSHTPGTFSVKSDEECYYTSIVVGGSEVMIADGNVSITKEGGVYSIAASFMDENENIRQFSYVGAIAPEDESLMAVSQNLNYTGQYGTFFATKAAAFDFYFTVSRAAKPGEFPVNYVSLTLYTPESTTPTAVPVGKYTLAAGNEIPYIDNPIYNNGNLNAQPWTFTWSGNNKDENEYGSRTYTEIKDGAEVEITKENGKYYISIKATIRSFYNVCEWDSEWEYWAWKYDDEGNPIVEYGDWFDYEAKIPFVTDPVAADVAIRIKTDDDFEFTGTCSIQQSYTALWYGDCYTLGGNGFVSYWSYADDVYTLYLPVHSSSEYTYAATGTHIPYGTYTFTETKPTVNSDFMCNIKRTAYRSIQNTYTGSSVIINSGTMKFTESWVEIDLQGTLTSKNPAENGKTVHYTGKLPGACSRINNYSAASRITQMAWMGE